MRGCAHNGILMLSAGVGAGTGLFFERAGDTSDLAGGDGCNAFFLVVGFASSLAGQRGHGPAASFQDFFDCFLAGTAAPVSALE